MAVTGLEKFAQSDIVNQDVTLTYLIEIPSLTMILTPRAELRTQRAFFNAALALLGMVEGIYDGPELSLG